MSCDVTKLDYLNQTKQLFRQTIDPDGKKISDKTPFRDYRKYMGNNSEPKAAALSATALFGKVVVATKVNDVDYVTEG